MVAAIGDEGVDLNGFIRQVDTDHLRRISITDELTPIKAVDDDFAVLDRDPKRQAPARTAAIESQHQARCIRRIAVLV